MRGPRLLGVAMATALLAGCSSAGAPQVVELTATPVEGTSSEPTSPTPTPSVPPTPSPSPEVTPSPGPREATDTDRARFAERYRPEGSSDLEFVAVDVDGGGGKEIVFAYVDTRERASRIDVAWWDGFEYGMGASGVGGPAARIERLRVSDVNLDGRIEIATFQSTSERSSLSLWQVPDDRRALVPLVARGGCADGSHTYGAVGARFTDRDGDGVEDIEATCNEAPLPVSEWRSDRYHWRDGAYRHDVIPSPSPSPSPEGSPGDD